MTGKCSLCPRCCGVDRENDFGFCRAGSKIKIARAELHFWEEPCISGTAGSGAVFFCGCNLKCVYCQNFEISHGDTGAEIDEERLCEIFLKLQEKGAHNINLVTPTHYVSQISTALYMAGDKLKIPVVYNCGGYEAEEGLSKIRDYASIYLTDMKYADNALAKRYSLAENYCETALCAIDKMLSAAPEPRLDENGIMKSGVIVRHMVLPSHRRDSLEVLKKLKERFGTDRFILSLMSQYTPNGELEDFPEINRRVTSFEYNSVIEAALELGFKNAYMQERSSASEKYTPPFDLSGVYT